MSDGSSIIGHLFGLYGIPFLVIHSLTVIFVVFGIFNLIAATFVETVMEAARQKRQLTSEEEACRVFIKLRQLVLKFGGCRALQISDDDGGQVGKVRTSVMESRLSTAPPIMPEKTDYCGVHDVYFQFGGQVTREAFNHVMQDTEVHTLFDDLEVHIADRFELFDVIDADGNGNVDVSELILGILKLRSGGADKSDMVAAILGIRAIQRTSLMVLTMVEDMKEETESLHQDIAKCRSEVRTSLCVQPVPSARKSHHRKVQPVAPLAARASVVEPVAPSTVK